MQQVSSNLTLMLRIFIPVLLAVFFGAFTLYFLFDQRAYYGNVSGTTVRVGFVAFYVAMLAFFAFTLWRLRRVEMGRDWVYVTDYFRQARYPWGNIREVRETSLGIGRLVRVRFYEPGSFGESALFLASGSRWQLFKEEHPERLAKVLK